MRPTRRLSACAVPALVAATITLSCSDKPTEPSAAVRMAITPETEMLSVALGDVGGRLSSSIAETAARARFEGYVNKLAAAIDNGDAESARKFLTRARNELDAQDGKSNSIDTAADRAAIALALDAADAILNPAAITAP